MDERVGRVGTLGNSPATSVRGIPTSVSLVPPDDRTSNLILQTVRLRDCVEAGVTSRFRSFAKMLRAVAYRETESNGAHVDAPNDKTD